MKKLIILCLALLLLLGCALPALASGTSSSVVTLTLNADFTSLAITRDGENWRTIYFNENEGKPRGFTLFAREAYASIPILTFTTETHTYYVTMRQTSSLRFVGDFGTIQVSDSWKSNGTITADHVEQVDETTFPLEEHLKAVVMDKEARQKNNILHHLLLWGADDAGMPGEAQQEGQKDKDEPSESGTVTPE